MCFKKPLFAPTIPLSQIFNTTELSLKAGSAGEFHFQKWFAPTKKRTEVYSDGCVRWFEVARGLCVLLSPSRDTWNWRGCFTWHHSQQSILTDRTQIYVR